jgi:hypothetical protein
MFIQGDLQAVFDALYEIGAIDPVLKQDWISITDEMAKTNYDLNTLYRSVNACAGDRELLIQKLKFMDQKAVTFLAMEVAREFAEFQDRKEIH